MTEPSSCSTAAESEASVTEHTIEPLQPNEEPVTQVPRAVGLNDTHACPLHRTADGCLRNHIDPKDEEITCRLINPTITFDESQEQLREKTRGGSKILPSTIYRTFYEGSATLASRVSNDTHVRHRQNKSLKLQPGNAFQTVGEVDLNIAVTKEGITRHLVWNKKKNPSMWISMFNEWKPAKKRAEFHYDVSARIGQRVTIAEISTAGLIAATLHADCETVWQITTRGRYLGKQEHRSVTIRKVDIPIWVHRSARPVDGSSITGDQFMASQADLFVFIKELRNSNLVAGPDHHSRRRTIHADGHNYEVLALGRIREDRITKNVPFDGKAFHWSKPSYTVRSEDATDNWEFDFQIDTWRLESGMSSTVRKRKTAEAIDDNLQVGSKGVHKAKRRNSL